MVKLYYCRIPETIDEQLIPYLSEYRKNKLAGISSLKLRRQGVCAELLLEKAVANTYKRPLPIVAGENGKPVFVDGALHFNISHSGDWVACAISDCEVGLDIQTKVDYKPELCKRYFRAEEQEYIFDAEDRVSAFTEIWCKKEAKLKSNGLGLKGGLASFSVFENESEFAFGKLGQLFYAVCSKGLGEIQIIHEEVKLL